MSKLSRDRGNSFEREVANFLTAALGFPVKRKLGQARDSGDDIQVGKYRHECKRRRKIAVYDWIKQCIRATDPGEVPVVVCRADGEESLVIMRLEDYVTLLRGEL